MMHAHVRDVMTTRVVAVRADASYKELAAMLRKHHVSGFPVVNDDGVVIGVVSETDLLAKEALDGSAGTGALAGLRHRGERAKAAALTAGALMTSPAVTIGADATVRRASRLMCSRKVRRLPVVDNAGRLVGVISRADVLSVFSRPDAEIRREITEDVILDGFFTDPASLSVTVENGIVTLEGSPGSATLGYGIACQAGDVEGVVAVRDRFSYPRGAVVRESGQP